MQGISNLIKAGDTRSDSLAAQVPNMSFVVPADAVKTIGGGDHAQGHAILSQMAPKPRGIYEEASYGPVRLSREEYVFMPDQVAALGNGDIQAGAQALQGMVQGITGRPIGHPVKGK